MNLYDSFLLKLRKSAKRILKKGNSYTIQKQTHSEGNRVVDAEQLLEIVPSKKNSKIIGSNWLINFHNNNASEHGEDGIIAKIFELLQPENKWVCEFGAHDPEIISNTWRLINKEGWNALLIEADENYFEKLTRYYKNSSTVHCVHTKVSFEGHEKLDNILKNTSVPSDLDFMVIDIDGNDYHVWEAINDYQAKVLMIEFNASIPSDLSFTQERDLSINQGSSLKAMVELGAKKGYKLIAVTAWNAFFVKEQYYHLFFKEEPALDDMYVFPAKHPIWTRVFQLYDGTIQIASWDAMLWHKIDLKLNDYQVLPESYRVFSRELAAQDFVIEKSGKKSQLQEENAEHLQKIYQMPANSITQFAKNVYSRYGEDGILEKLAYIVNPDKTCLVDVGAWDGITHSRSRYLLDYFNWNGLLLENDPSMLDKLRNNNKDNKRAVVHEGLYGLSGESSLDAIFKAYDLPKEFEVLTLNSYGMEYYLWESLVNYVPKVVAVQFNPTIANEIKFVQPKDFSVHQGASLRAFYELAHYKGYELVGVTLQTAFFVRRDYFYRLFEEFKIKYADLDDMFCPIEMRFFQLYDGTIALQGLDRLMWHGIRIDKEKLQVVPSALRKFHQFADSDYKKFFYRI